MQQSQTPLFEQPEIDEIVRSVQDLDYRKRREFLWRKVRPRLYRFLYKFRSIAPSDKKNVDHMRDIIVRSRLWLSSPVDFNDPFDMSAQLIADAPVAVKRERIKRALKQQGMKWNDIAKKLPLLTAKPNSHFAELARDAYQRYRGSVGVFSFGGDPRSILMWSHYASNHEGVCLQFEVAKDLNSFAKALHVEYNDEYPVVNWLADFLDGLTKAILRKHKKWAYEHEHRVILLDQAHQYIPFLPEALRAIIIGCRTTGTTIEKLQELLVERESVGHPLPMLYRVVQHQSRYRLVIQKFR